MRRSAFLLLSLLAATPSLLVAQNVPSQPPPGQLDPTRNLSQPVLFSSFHQPLPEQYIWTADPPNLNQAQRDEPRYFRVHLHLDTVPETAELYLAGSRAAEVYLNGWQAAHFATDPLSRLEMHVFHVDIARQLHPGDNVLAIKADHGRTLVAKIVPAAPGVLAAPILISGPEWRASTRSADRWQNTDFNDSAWPAVAARGSIEGNIDFLQWNNDAGLYDWPGYEGESPFLAHTFLPAAELHDVYAGQGSFENTDALTTATDNSAHEFTVKFAAIRSLDEFVPALTLDFGREVDGRVQIVSDTDAPAIVSVAYGESLGELNNEPYLGT
ncbi:MAG: alpha-L-rhamnosidase, partial [Acidobacteriaceae bacterium]